MFFKKKLFLISWDEFVFSCVSRVFASAVLSLTVFQMLFPFFSPLSKKQLYKWEQCSRKGTGFQEEKKIQKENVERCCCLDRHGAANSKCCCVEEGRRINTAKKAHCVALLAQGRKKRKRLQSNYYFYFCFLRATNSVTTLFLQIVDVTFIALTTAFIFYFFFACSALWRLFSTFLLASQNAFSLFLYTVLSAWSWSVTLYIISPWSLLLRSSKYGLCVCYIYLHF